MEQKYVSLKNIKFLLYDVFNAESLIEFSFYKDHSRRDPLPGIIAIAWQWLLQAVIAAKALKNDNLNISDSNFYTGKLFTFKFFFNYELPKIEGLLIRLRNSDGLTVKMKLEYFEDWYLLNDAHTSYLYHGA